MYGGSNGSFGRGGGSFGRGGGGGGNWQGGGYDQNEMVNHLVNEAQRMLNQGQGGGRDQGHQQGWGGQQQRGYDNQGGRKWVGEMQGRVQPYLKGKSDKNHRPRVKEDGKRPFYNVNEYRHMDQSMFNCYLCKKNKMWDPESFLMHIHGGAHNAAAEKEIKEGDDVLEEVREKLRQNAKNKNASGACRMCTIPVDGHKESPQMIEHRKTDVHQMLKKFVHPHCYICDADFELRSEWTYHKFTAEHLTNWAYNGGKVMAKGDKHTSIKELRKLIEDLDGGRPYVPYNSGAKRKVGETPMDVDDHDALEALDIDQILKDVDCYNDDLSGSEHVKPVNGFFCDVCKKFFGPGRDAVKTHCTTDKHLAKFKLAEMKNDHEPSAKKANRYDLD